MSVKSDIQILIVGAGCFGISTAFHLLKRGYKNVTVIDRASELPAVDAASTDINKSANVLARTRTFRAHNGSRPQSSVAHTPTSSTHALRVKRSPHGRTGKNGATRITSACTLFPPLDLASEQ